jgi:DNA-binding CsgD family transcriptional regulator
MMKCNYIDDVVIPLHTPLLNGKHNFIIRNLSGQFILASHNFAQLLGYPDGFALRGKTDSQLGIKLLDNYHEAVNTSNLIKPRFMVYTLKKPKTILINRSTPLFNPEGQLIAVKNYVQKFNMLTPFAIIDGLQVRSFARSHFVPHNLEFTDEEQTVMFMLVLQFTRSEIAEFLGIHQSKLTRVITRLAVKFNLGNNSQELLIQAIIRHGLHRFIPAQFIDKILEFIIHEPANSHSFRLLGFKND